MSLRPGNIGSIKLNGTGVGGLTSETYNPFSPLEAGNSISSTIESVLGGTYSAAPTQSDPESLPLQ